jgi:hypothetical protein
VCESESNSISRLAKGGNGQERDGD